MKSDVNLMSTRKRSRSTTVDKCSGWKNSEENKAKQRKEKWEKKLSTETFLKNDVG